MAKLTNEHYKLLGDISTKQNQNDDVIYYIYFNNSINNKYILKQLLYRLILTIILKIKQKINYFSIINLLLLIIILVNF